ncbi:hypothetical protein [Enterococcus faecium]|uniref:hypothetical protein n=1 Tax=Enterococcus faecium TaxID=1352 RepID=UPI001F3D955A|nr:hypothetical protein [Enterococcus faecium]MCF8636759.1 hypothetical protein [Enterococcus faecium]
MKLYMVKTDRDRSLMTESKKQALKDFEREIDYIESDEIDVDDRFVNLIEIDLYDFLDAYKLDSDVDIDDLIDDVAKIIKEQHWIVTDDGFAERVS